MQKAVLNAVEVRDVEVEHVYDDGIVVSLLGSALPLYDEKGAVRGGVGVFADFTERKQLMDQLAASEARFTAFMDNLPAQALMKRADGTYIYANRAVAEATGIAPEHWIGHSDEELFPGIDFAPVHAAERAMLEQGEPNRSLRQQSIMAPAATTF